MGGQRARVRRGEDLRAAGTEPRCELLRVATPQQRDERQPGASVVCGEPVDDGVGDLLPAPAAVRAGLAVAEASVDGERLA